MPLIKNPGREVRVGNLRIIMGVIGPIIRTPEGGHIPYLYDCYHCGGMRVEIWSYKTGPIKRAELVTEDGQKTLWFGWR